jgi:hypothetical protein
VRAATRGFEKLFALLHWGGLQPGHASEGPKSP